MDKRKVAKELVKLAKDLTGASIFEIYPIGEKGSKYGEIYGDINFMVGAIPSSDELSKMIKKLSIKMKKKLEETQRKYPEANIKQLDLVRATGAVKSRLTFRLSFGKEEGIEIKSW